MSSEFQWNDRGPCPADKVEGIIRKGLKCISYSALLRVPSVADVRNDMPVWSTSKVRAQPERDPLSVSAFVLTDFS